MEKNNLIDVEVAYATPDRQCILPLKVAANSTLKDIILASKIQDIFPEIDLAQQKVGVFGIEKGLHDIAKPGDRIEIYRQLAINPIEARRLRAKLPPK